MNDIYNYLKISDSLATAGQPTSKQFADIKDNNYQVIINLALINSVNALLDEKEIVESQGMKYIHIPVIWENPTWENFSEFKNTMDANTDKNVFVHCAANKRVSAFIYLYRLFQGISSEVAKTDLNKIWIPNPIWQNFIGKIVHDYLCD